MSNRNRFLLATPSASNSSTTPKNADPSNNAISSSPSGASAPPSAAPPSDSPGLHNNRLSVDSDFDSYWEEESRNPHRNRIRIGRQYQATVPPLLKPGENDQRKSEDLETLSFCPKRSARISDAELEHYFKVANSLNLLARGKNIDLNDLNPDRQKEATSEIASDNKIANHSSPDTVDPRLSVYNFHEDPPKTGAEVKPLKAKPIIPNASTESDAANSNVGSLKFFMDGQLVLKLNAFQEQQEGIEKCHWVQSGDKVVSANRQKRYTKRADKSIDSNQNGSHSNSVVSSFQDDDSKNDDLTGGEESKEFMSSISNLSQQKICHGSPSSKRSKSKTTPPATNNFSIHQQIQMQQNQQPQQLQQHGSSLASAINYNRLAVNNRMRERNEILAPSPVINPAMPWLHANGFAMAASLLGSLPFAQAPSSIIDTHAQDDANAISSAPKPMDLTLEHNSPKAPRKPTSRSKTRAKNN